jgi:bifunctional DNA-binding transcriptional regulator/antitoxin component of YhaV-PrlF toxin-antitoxin module
VNRRAQISPWHQVTIPLEAMRSAGLSAGDRLTVRVDGPGRLVLECEMDILELFAGVLTGVYEAETLSRLRGEWD